MIDEYVWVLGGRKRIITPPNSLLYSPEFESEYTDSIYTSDTKKITDDFQLSNDKKLPIGLAFHCAIYLEELNDIFVHGGQKSDTEPSSHSFLYSLAANLWKELPQIDTNCNRVPLFHETQCGLNQGHLIIIPQLESCTAIFDLNSMTWTTITNDGRKSVYGGVMVNRGLNKNLYFLGGREYLHRNGSKDRFVRVTGHEYVQTYRRYKWVYAEVDIPSMRNIYEYDQGSNKWKLWPNKLPLPVNNNTVVSILGLFPFIFTVNFG